MHAMYHIVTDNRCDRLHAKSVTEPMLHMGYDGSDGSDSSDGSDDSDIGDKYDDA